MLNSLRLYLHYISVSIRGQMQYKTSFILMAAGGLLLSFTEFLGVWVLFDRFGSIKGWTLPEAALLYGIANTAFSVTEAFARGFDMFPAMVKGGDFDRLLLRPRSTVLQLFGQELQFMRIGKFLQGLTILIWASSTLNIDWTVMHVLLLLGSVFGGICMFAGLFVVQATISFWTIETLELMNTVTYGGVEAAQYPLVIYRTWFQRFFTFIVPLAAFSYFPVLAILGRPDPLGTPEIFHWLAPMIGVLFLAFTLQLWKVGVKHYCSTGS
ncbi:MAG: ABC transporter permease [Armatimonadota bacterium]